MRELGRSFTSLMTTRGADAIVVVRKSVGRKAEKEATSTPDA
jgi:hypothetical protein